MAHTLCVLWYRGRRGRRGPSLQVWAPACRIAMDITRAIRPLERCRRDPTSWVVRHSVQTTQLKVEHSQTVQPLKQMNSVVDAKSHAHASFIILVVRAYQLGLSVRACAHKSGSGPCTFSLSLESLCENLYKMYLDLGLSFVVMYPRPPIRWRPSYIHIWRRKPYIAHGYYLNRFYQMSR